MSELNENVEFSGNMTGSDNIALDNYNSGTVNLRANTGKTMVFDDEIISRTATANNIVNINNDYTDASGTVTSYDGTVVFNKDVSGQKEVNLINGVLKLGEDGVAAPEVENLNINGGLLDIANGVMDDGVNIASISTDAKIKFDIDFTGATADFALSDMINVDAGTTIKFDQVNFLNDLALHSTKIKFASDYINTEDVIISSTVAPEYRYLFKANICKYSIFFIF